MANKLFMLTLLLVPAAMAAPVSTENDNLVARTHGKHSQLSGLKSGFSPESGSQLSSGPQLNAGNGVSGFKDIGNSLPVGSNQSGSSSNSSSGSALGGLGGNEVGEQGLSSGLGAGKGRKAAKGHGKGHKKGHKKGGLSPLGGQGGAQQQGQGKGYQKGGLSPLGGQGGDIQQPNGQDLGAIGAGHSKGQKLKALKAVGSQQQQGAALGQDSVVSAPALLSNGTAVPAVSAVVPGTASLKSADGNWGVGKAAKIVS